MTRGGKKIATDSELPPPEVVACGLSIEAFTGELR